MPSPPSPDSQALLAGFSAKLRLLGISTVAGNQTVEKVTHNALRFLEVAGLGHIGALSTEISAR